MLPRWVARLLGRGVSPAKEVVGLALSGGAVRGFAHIGVLQALEESGIKPDVVAGVSAGAIVGALYCAGIPPQRMVDLAHDIGWRTIGRITRPGLGLFDISPLERTLTDLIEDKCFEELVIPFVTLSVDLLTGEVVIHREGCVARAVRASCALPGIFTPVIDGERVLVDGGLRNNLPVSIARHMGADYVIAVNLHPRPTRPSKPPTSLFEVWSLALYTMRRNLVYEAGLADCLVEPDIADASYVDFGQAEALIRKGYEAGEEAVTTILRELPRRFPASG